MTPYRGLSVPPNPLCPSIQQGKRIDLSEEDFRLFVNYELNHVDMIVAFGDPNGTRHGGIVESNVLTEPVDSNLVKKVHRIITSSTSRYKDLRGTAIVEATESKTVAKMRDMFLDRVRGCPGVEGGKCWALNEHALREVLEAV